MKLFFILWAVFSILLASAFTVGVAMLSGIFSLEMFLTSLPVSILYATWPAAIFAGVVGVFRANFGIVRK